jgi:peptide/nickel transport system permease protein
MLATLRRSFGQLGQSDLWLELRASRSVLLVALCLAILIVSSFASPLIAPQNPSDLATVNLLDGGLPPAWQSGGDTHYVLGTDQQGRDVYSSILYGLRLSITVGLLSVVLAMAIGVALGIAAGYMGGIVDGIVMRLVDVMLSFPAILVALLVNGAARSALPQLRSGILGLVVVILSIALTGWVQYARAIRSLTLVEKNKEYVLAARCIGQRSSFIAIFHILPNAFASISVLATLNFAMAILTEATLSFLGAGVPPTEPSIGTLIRVGNEYMFSGQWWVVLFPSIALVLLVLSTNIFGEWLRDALNPRLQ